MRFPIKYRGGGRSIYSLPKTLLAGFCRYGLHIKSSTIPTNLHDPSKQTYFASPLLKNMKHQSKKNITMQLEKVT